MAIGKVNAYATVQAPNVDFGQIAVNAQKFQADMADKLKDLKALKTKEVKPVEVAKFDEVIPAGVKVHDVAVNNIISEQKNRYAELHKLATEKGGLDKLSSEEQVEYNNIPGVIKKYTEINSKIREHAKTFIDNQGKKSGVQQDQTKLIAHGLDNLEDTEPIVSNGSIIYKFPEIETFSDDKGNIQRKFKLDENGNKVYKTFYDRDGNKRDSFDDNELLNGKAFNVIDDYTLNDDAKKIADSIELRTVKTDNGVVSIQNTYNNDQRVKEAVDSMIDGHVANREQRINVLYNYAQRMLTRKDISPEEKENLQRYLHPLKEEEYTDQDKQIVRDEYKTAIFGGLAPEYKKDVNLESKYKKEDRDNLKPVVTLAEVPIHKFLNDKITNKNKGVYSFRNKTTLQGDIDGVVVVSSKNHKAGDSFTVPAGSSVRQMTFDKKGAPLAKVGSLVFKNQTLSPDAQAQMIASINDAAINGASDTELQVKARSMGADYESVWMSLPTAAANEINYGGGETVESLKKGLYLKQPKSKAGKYSKYNK